MIEEGKRRNIYVFALSIRFRHCPSAPCIPNTPDPLPFLVLPVILGHRLPQPEHPRMPCRDIELQAPPMERPNGQGPGIMTRRCRQDIVPAVEVTVTDERVFEAILLRLSQLTALKPKEKKKRQPKRN
jgi:hypothetical protein